MWWIFALLSALFAALTAIFAKVGIKNVHTELAVAIRTVVILLMAWAIAFARGGFSSFGLLTKSNLWFLALSGITTGLSWIFYFHALRIGKVAQVASVDKLSLALTIIFSAIFLGEAINIKTAIGAGFIIAGALIMIL
jgi:bacterial/archaeal transporter family protein